MIAAIRGILEARSSDAVVVGIGGLSVRVIVPASTLQRLGSVGEQVELRTHLYFREDVLALYGFASEDERNLFETLLSVSGIGPKLALGILSAASSEAIRTAIAEGDVDTLSRIPGLGKKTAGRLVLELRGKVDNIVASAAGGPAADGDAEVLAALTNLGYSSGDVLAALRTLPNDAGLTVEEKIRRALQYFAHAREHGPR